MSPAALAAGILSHLPEPLDWVALIVITVLLAAMIRVGADLLFVAGPQWMHRRWLERKAVRVLLRHRRARGAERARQDVAVQAETRSFQSWDADLDRVWPENVVPFERKTSAEVIPLATRVMDSDGIGGAA